MKLAGLQKLTLLDFPGIVACTVFTVGCNFKCPFCHNASLVNGTAESFIDEAELLSFLKKRQGILEGVVVTGGEPLLNRDIGRLIAEIKELGYLVKLDTNGTSPDVLKKLAKEKLIDYVAMDIKNSPEEYGRAVGIARLDISAVEESKDYLLSGEVDYEFRTTVVKGIHTRESLLSLAEWISGAERYYLQQYKASDDILSPFGLSEFSKEEMQELLNEVSPLVKTAGLRGL